MGASDNVREHSILETACYHPLPSLWLCNLGYGFQVKMDLLFFLPLRFCYKLPTFCLVSCWPRWLLGRLVLTFSTELFFSNCLRCTELKLQFRTLARVSSENWHGKGRQGLFKKGELLTTFSCSFFMLLLLVVQCWLDTTIDRLIDWAKVNGRIKSTSSHFPFESISFRIYHEHALPFAWLSHFPLLILGL